MKEGTDVLRKLRERELMPLNLSVPEKGQVQLRLRLKIVEDETGKIRDKNEARDFFPAVFAREVFDVGKSLRFSQRKVFAKAFVFDQQPAFPEQVNRAFVPFEITDVLLKRGDRGTTQAEDLEKVVPESLLLGGFGAVQRMLAGEVDSTVADFVPRKMQHSQEGEERLVLERSTFHRPPFPSNAFLWECHAIPASP
jgi:hypothetical protein